MSPLPEVPGKILGVTYHPASQQNTAAKSLGFETYYTQIESLTLPLTNCDLRQAI